MLGLTAQPKSMLTTVGVNNRVFLIDLTLWAKQKRPPNPPGIQTGIGISLNQSTFSLSIETAKAQEHPVERKGERGETGGERLWKGGRGIRVGDGEE